MSPFFKTLINQVFYFFIFLSKNAISCCTYSKKLKTLCLWDAPTFHKNICVCVCVCVCDPRPHNLSQGSIILNDFKFRFIHRLKVE